MVVRPVGTAAGQPGEQQRHSQKEDYPGKNFVDIFHGFMRQSVFYVRQSVF
jgi:hypothetical protein